ncbi:MAG: DsbA family protein [Hyphomicrobiales bacterium]|nr:MAG: DsbA family protein [Hyphomicrobiales bacterium]
MGARATAMMRTLRLTTTLAALLLLGMGLLLLQISVAPAQTPDGAFTPTQKAAIEQMIHAYIVSHPEVLVEAQEALNKRAETDRVENIRRVLSKHRDELYRQAGDLVLGNPQADVAIIEFYDYNCPYCRRVAPELAQRIAADSKLKLILKPLPYITPASPRVAYLAAAAVRQGRFADYHAALLASKGQATEASALRLAQDLSLDVARLKHDADLPEVKASVDRSADLAKTLNIEGTPFFFIDDHYISGVPDDFAARLDGAIVDVRKGGCKLC